MFIVVCSDFLDDMALLLRQDLELVGNLLISRILVKKCKILIVDN